MRRAARAIILDEDDRGDLFSPRDLGVPLAALLAGDVPRDPVALGL